MEKNLHVLFPAESYIEGGAIEPVELHCVDINGKTKPLKAIKVLLIITEDPFSIEETTVLDEVHNFLTDVIYATKLINPCNGDVIYVAEYINDITPFFSCCSGENLIENALIDFDDEYIIDYDNATIFY